MEVVAVVLVTPFGFPHSESKEISFQQTPAAPFSTSYSLTHNHIVRITDI